MDLTLALRISGIVGIVASLIMVAADTIFLGRSESFQRFPIKFRTVGFPFWRLNVGSTLGVSMIPFVAVGFIPLYFLLLPIGQIWSGLTTGLLMYFFAMAPGAHVQYANNGIIQDLRNDFKNPSPQTKVLDQVSKDQTRIFMGMGYIILAAYFLGSLLYSILVLTGKTNLPIWMAVINPFAITAIAYSSSHWLHSVISGYLSPISVYIGVTTLQILLLIHLWQM